MPKFPLAALVAALALAAIPVHADTPAPAPTPSTSSAVQAVPWWQAFGDASLSSLVDQGLRANLDIEQALARIEQSRALLAGARAERGPSGGATLGQTTSLAARERNDTVQAGLAVSWEIDLFGRLKSHAGAAHQRFHATQAQADGVRLAVAAEIAHSWFALQGAREQLLLARTIAQGRERTLTLVQARVRAGSAGPIDEARAAAELDAVLADIPVHEAAEQVALHRLAVLTGRSPAGFEAPSMPTHSASIVLPLGDLHEALAHRPDLVEHEALLAARSLDVQAVRAELMPRLTFTGALGFVAGSAASLASGGTLSWLSAPSLLVPLLDRPRIEARVDGARAQEREALAAYRQRVLLAVEELENSLAHYSAGERRFNAIQRRAAHAATAERLARVRYEAGAADLLELLDAQRGAREAQAQLALALMQQRQNLVAVYKAIGGRAA